MPRFLQVLTGAAVITILLSGWALWQAYGLPVALLAAFALC